LGLTHSASKERISSGIPRLDAMLGGKGFFRGSSVLVSGTAGSGKSTLAAKFVSAACQRGERALYFAFEESPGQIQRNMRSVNIDLAPWVQKGLLKFHASRPTYFGLEMHLLAIHSMIRKFKPSVVVIDPITNLIEIGTPLEVKSMLTRLIDFLKTENISSMFTSLTAGGANLDQSEVGVSSLMDAWMVVRNLETGGERNRALYVLKARGVAHSNQVREFVISDKGVELVDVYLSGSDVLIGSARVAREAQDQLEKFAEKQRTERRQLNLAHQRKAIEAQIAALTAELETKTEEARLELNAEEQQETKRSANRDQLARQRSAY
jgi:circadian clock protein KaiC